LSRTAFHKKWGIVKGNMPLTRQQKTPNPEKIAIYNDFSDKQIL
jgi:hypothetical protein